MGEEDTVDAGVPGKLKIKKEGLAKSVRALVQLVKKRTASANNLFESSGETMTVLFTLGKVPLKKKNRPFIIELPHPMFDETSEVCFFSKSPQKPWKEMLVKNKSIPGLNKVIGMDKLNTNYNTLEAKKALCEAFDLFLCDAAIADVLPRSLGRIFYKERHKIPVPVNINLGGNPEEHIKKVIRSAHVRIPAGPCMGVKIGRCGMPEEHLTKNAAAVITGVAKLLHERHDNYILNISVQATNAPALPVWRRAVTPGGPIDLKKHRNSEATSSAASETGSSFASDAESVNISELPSDAGETLSTRDTVSEQETMDDTTHSEMDTEAGDVDSESAPEKKDMPLMKGLSKRAKRRQAPGSDAAVAAEKAAEAEPEVMPPPAKKAKKGKSKAA